MFTLNLPAFQYKISTEGGKTRIFDSLRHKYVMLTPEEWVRQHFVNYLIVSKGYPPERIVNEAQINLNGQKKRCDSVFFDKDLNPLIIFEYKAPTVMINQKVFEQVYSYNWSLRVRYLVVSNGLKHYCCEVDYESQSIAFLEDVPEYRKLINE
jgi:hypothetical protein